jgi:hypothetical protein
MSLKNSLLALSLFSVALHLQAAPSSDQLIECTSYYHISAKTLSQMNMPQMQQVTQRLAQSEKTLREELTEINADNWQDLLNQEITRHQSLVNQAGNLSPLMQKYKTPCKALVQNL